MSQKARNHLGDLLKLYDKDLKSRFGTADFKERDKLKGAAVEAALYLGAQFMAIAMYVMDVATSHSDDFQALLVVGVPQLIGYQYNEGRLYHNKVAKEIADAIGKLG